MTRILSPIKNASEADLVMTSPALARMIVDYFKPIGRCMDPARGTGAFYNALKPWAEKRGWCEISNGRDFFTEDIPRCDWIITNPPWSKLRAFLIHAMMISDNVVFLATMVHFVTRARMRDIREAGFGMKTALLIPQPPAPWPSSGFQLVAMHLERGYDGPLFIDHSRLL